MPKVSVIISTYNRAHFLTDAIDSVLAQTYKNYEVCEGNIICTYPVCTFDYECGYDQFVDDGGWDTFASSPLYDPNDVTEAARIVEEELLGKQPV